MLRSCKLPCMMSSTTTSVARLKASTLIIFLKIILVLLNSIAILILIASPLSFKLPMVPFGTTGLLSILIIEMCFRQRQCSRWTGNIILIENFIVLFCLKKCIYQLRMLLAFLLTMLFSKNPHIRMENRECLFNEIHIGKLHCCRISTLS